MNYRKVNNIVGWVAFIIATTVYLMTMEPTTSFWDCGEFLSCGYKLEVGHSPGAPFFMLIQRMFGILAGGDVTKVALMINAWSAIASGLTILFLFWTITHFAKKLVVTEGTEEPTGQQLTLIMGAGLVGALAYTFSDTFWFSAVEAEVYATSSLFTALVFWAALKWEHVANNKHADRWLVFIFFMMGLSIATHLLNLLTIPAVALLYYYKRYTVTTMGAIVAFLIGCVVLGLIQFGMIQGLPYLAFKFDLFFVNNLGMPFDSGAIFFLIIFVALLIGLLRYAKKKDNYLLHTGMLCAIFVIIGYSSYLVPVLRSRADVPIDMTNPDNANTFLSYVNREQFGQQPLLFGPDFDTPPVEVVQKGKWYEQSKRNGKDFYEEVGDKLDYKYESERFFPRIWDANQNHPAFYRSYLGLAEGESPTTADNFRFFFSYQLNWMWWRYFMWNYAGRQNDFEGQGGPKLGNWISGISAIDKMFVGDLDKMGDGYKNNRARNELYFLPFILGLLGIVYQFNRNKRDGIITFMLFFFTGIAIVLFLNNTPVQPRERDYAYAGSTYAFAIWIGLGVMMVNEWLQRLLKGSIGIYATILICLLAVPTLMASEEWDDHDRSKKTLARATAVNTLNSCAPNAILFTYGDNDTYPVWYAQEVEGIRTDVRVINTSLLGIGWYIDQLNYKVNEADAVPMIWKSKDYVGDRKNYVRYFDNPQIPKDRYFSLAEICAFITSTDPANQLRTMNGEMSNYLPSKNFTVPSLTKEQLIASGLLKANDSLPIDTDMRFTLPGDAATKDDLAILNIVAAIAGDGWKRPIYFGAGGDSYAGLNDYLRLEGTVYRLVPFKQSIQRQTAPGEYGSVNVDKSYDLFMKYSYGGAERNDVYVDEKNKMSLISYRINVARIADELSARGRKTEAIQILDKVMAGISERAYQYDFECYLIVAAYYRAGAMDKARKLGMKLAKNFEDDVKYVMAMSNEGARESLANDVQRDISGINIIGNFAAQGGDSATAKELNNKVQTLSQMAISKMGQESFQRQ